MTLKISSSSLPVSEQTVTSLEKNINFFLDNHEQYKKNISSIDTYLTISDYLNKELEGINNLLDIGNGGVFDYNTTLIKNITGLDLFLDSISTEITLQPNVTMVQGSALSIPEGLNNFDGVIMVMLVHHLVGSSPSACKNNVEKAFKEAFRVLDSGGKLIVMDSCIPLWFYLFEYLAFKPVSWIIEKTITHPPAFQYTSKQIEKMMIKSGFKEVTFTKIPKGKFILQFGFKVPSFLTPVQPTLFVGHRS